MFQSVSGRIWICRLNTLIGCTAMSLLSPMANPALAETPAKSGDLCWPAAALDGKPVDKKIRKETPLAIVPPPKGELRPFAPAAERGAIRRVELPPNVRKLALTFDLCEQPNEVAGYDSELIKLLRREKVRATIFAGGKWLETHPEQAKQLIADPLFELGNHSWTHRNVRLLSGEDLTNEIKWVQLSYERQIDEVASRRCLNREGHPVAKTKANERLTLFRFPFGACNKAALDAVADLGLVPVQWDVSSGDPSPGTSAQAMIEDVVRRVKPGSIVLFHANGRGWHTAQALETIVPKLRAEGYEFATVSELLQTPGATAKYLPICYDSKPGDTDRYDALARRLEANYAKFRAKFAGPVQTTSTTTLKVPKPVPAVRKEAEKEPVTEPARMPRP